MKKRLLIFVLIFTVLVPQTFAQKKRKIDTGIHFGILGGGGIQTLTGTDYWGVKLDNKFTPGFHVGGNVIFSIFPDFWIQPGILFSVKGARQNIITDDITKTVSLSYVEVPLYLLYRPQLGNGHLLLGLGPYGGYGVFGRERVKSGTITTELIVKYLTDASEQPTTYVYYRGLDAGANIFFGYEFYNSILLQLNGQMGLLKVNSDYGLPNDKTSKKNFGFGLSVGYRF
jgi:Outer membrane protein beta-barrel domain